MFPASDIWKIMRRINEAIPDFRPISTKPTKYIPKIVDKLRLPPYRRYKGCRVDGLHVQKWSDEW